MNEMPMPAEETKKLHVLAGSWSGKETLHPSPWGPGGSAKGKVESRVECDGACVVQDYSQIIDRKVTYRGHGVLGYDAREKRYLMHWTDSMSGVPAQSVPGTWDGDTLTFAHAGPMGHFRYVYRFLGADKYDMRLESSQDGQQWAPFLEAIYKRKSGKKAKKAKAKAKSKAGAMAAKGKAKASKGKAAKSRKARKKR